jgi:hypothetical protein
MRRCLITILMALALAFAAAGCGPPHVDVPAPRVDVPAPHVPEQARDLYDSDLNNVHRHLPNENPGYTPDPDPVDTCYDDPYSYYC